MLRKSRPGILVVDDLVDAADSYAILLELWGYDTRVCYDGATALETARAFRPQAVLLDVAMPGMDGLQVARRLRGWPEFATTAIIGISGYCGATYRSQALQAGFDRYLAKPVDPDGLRDLLGHFAPQQVLFDMLEPEQQPVAISQVRS